MSFLINPYAHGGGGGGAPAFAPDDLASLQGWYDASQLSGSDGDQLATFPDMSGNGFDGTQASNQAYLRKAANGINGLSVLSWEGGSSIYPYYISASLLPSGGPTAATAFIVFVLTADPPAGGTSGGLFDDFGSTSSAAHHPFTDGVIYESFGTTVRKTVGNPTPALTSPRIYSVHSASADFKAFLDGVQIFSTGTNTVGFGGAPPRSIGANASITPILGKIAEVCFFDANLGTTDRQKMEGYLAHKWGLTGNLDAGHPYKSVAP